MRDDIVEDDLQWILKSTSSITPHPHPHFADEPKQSDLDKIFRDVSKSCLDDLKKEEVKHSQL